jgi:protein gp37
MSTSTAIQWTDITDNIIVALEGGWWCRMISEGCVNCYAAKLNQSEFFGGNKLPYTGAAPKLKLREDIIESWRHQTKPKKHFVASMTDIFGDWVPVEWTRKFLDGMALAPRQTFQLLTKRADVALDRVNDWLAFRGRSELPRNIWIGVSVENQKRADERIPILLQIPAWVRFLSVEPMLEPVDLGLFGALPEDKFPSDTLTLQLLHWVIVGGESGPNARLCGIGWVRSVVEQCQCASVPVFVKQLGSNPLAYFTRFPVKHPKGGDPAEWPEDLRVREFPA